MTKNHAQSAAALAFLYTESPLHVGSGAGLGAIDLPIQRERITRLPVVPGSGLKGALREAADERLEDHDVRALFGKPPPKAGESQSGDDYAGAINLADARLLLFPMRSARGGWAWLTAHLCLERLARDLEVYGGTLPALPSRPTSGQVFVSTQSTVLAGSGNVLLEDLEFRATPSGELDALATWLEGALPGLKSYDAYRERLRGQLVLMEDSDFTELAERCTEVATRVRLDPETRTVMKGALWTEESLPAESLLWSLAQVSRARRPDDKRGHTEMLGRLTALSQALTRLRLGGDQTTGRGLVGLRLWAGGEG